MVGQPYLYELPKIKEWNEDDEVSIGIRIGHHTLAECNCITLVGQDAIRMELPATYIGVSSTIAISLSDGLQTSYYYLIVAGRPFIPTNSGQISPQQNGSESIYGRRDGRHGLTQQEMLQRKLLGEDVDIDGEKKRHEKELSDKAYDKCIPIFTRMSRDGEITVKFDRRLIITYDVEDLMKLIVSSGSIQV